MRHLGAADDNTGPLPMGASTLGVRALLSIIDDDPKKVDWIGPFIRANRYHPDVALLFEDLCRLADMWRISKPVKTNKAAEPERRIAFSKLMASRLGSSTFDLLMLSMMMQDQAAAEGHARAIVLADLDPLTMPETARILLERFAPLYLIRIHTQFRLRESWWARVELRFKIEEPMGSNDFGLGCKKRGCAAYKAYQAKVRKWAAWLMLRSVVADAALQAMKIAGSEEGMDLSLVTAIRSVVECGVCRERFRKAFKAAISKEHQKSWTWDLSDSELIYKIPAHVKAQEVGLRTSTGSRTSRGRRTELRHRRTMCEYGSTWAILGSICVGGHHLRERESVRRWRAC